MKGKTVDIEAVRARALAACVSGEDEIRFYVAAIELGASDKEADRIDQILTERMMRARGAI